MPYNQKTGSAWAPPRPIIYRSATLRSALAAIPCATRRLISRRTRALVVAITCNAKCALQLLFERRAPKGTRRAPRARLPSPHPPPPSPAPPYPPPQGLNRDAVCGPAVAAELSVKWTWSASFDQVSFSCTYNSVKMVCVEVIPVL